MIRENYLRLRSEIPDYVKIVLAAKMRTKEEIEEAISAGGEIIGENYVQEAEKMYRELEGKARQLEWHLISTLQKNKINRALRIFDCIQSVDSVELAGAINKRAEKLDKKISVFIEINISSEITKAGVEPEYEVVETLAKNISQMNYLKLEGLMTVGPRGGNPEELRPYVRKTKEIFERLKSKSIPNVELRYLSMGMSSSYRVAIEEGANMVRLGTIIFGERACDLNKGG